MRNIYYIRAIYWQGNFLRNCRAGGDLGRADTAGHVDLSVNYSNGGDHVMAYFESCPDSSDN